LIHFYKSFRGREKRRMGEYSRSRGEAA